MSRSSVLAITLLLSASKVDGSCENGLEEDKAQAVLQLINEARSSLAKGELEGNGANFTAAKSMNQLAWSCELESDAAKLIGFCDMPIPSTIPIIADGLGWSHVWANHEPGDPAIEIEDMVQSVLDLRIIVNPRALSSYSSDSDPSFPNLMQAAATKLGCTIQRCPTAVDYYDEYVSALCLTDQTLTDGSEVYAEGSADDCECSGVLTCNPDTKLCELTTTTSTTTTTTTTTTTPTTTTTTTPTTTTTSTTITTTTTTIMPTTTTATTPTTTTTTTPTTTTITTTTPTTTTTTPAIQPSPNAVLPSSTAADTICPDNIYMTDKLRLNILDMHNSRRSLLALRKVTKNTGSYLPAAANMRKLRYDCELEFSAIKFASQCPKIGSTEDARADQGENFNQLTETGITSFEQAASKTVDSWWKVVQTYPSLGSAAKFRDTHVGTPIVTFTQVHLPKGSHPFFVRNDLLMAWAATAYLGCSVVHCSPFYTTVCRYSPKGNVVGETVYAPGDFCTACPSDTKCNAALYLCAP